MIVEDSLFELAGQSAFAIVVIFLRVGAMCFAMPALGEQMISARVRLIVALMLTAVVAPVTQVNLPVMTPSLMQFGSALATETVTGLFLGLVLRLFIIAIQTAGAIAAQSTSLAQIMGQAGADPLPAIGHVLTIAALALLMATGFHVKAAAFVIVSYEIFPPLEFPSPAAVADAGRARVAQSFRLAFNLAAPFVILAVIYNLTLGVINRAMPQLMVAFVGAPLITFGSIGLLFLTAPFILTAWLEAFETFLAVPFGS